MKFRITLRALVTIFAIGALLPVHADAMAQDTEPAIDGTEAYQRGDYETARRLFQDLAEDGNAAAQYNLGVMYENGDGVAVDSATAAQWYRRAAGQGYRNAQHNLALMYLNGTGVRRNYALAFDMFRRAAAVTLMLAA